MMAETEKMVAQGHKEHKEPTEKLGIEDTMVEMEPLDHLEAQGPLDTVESKDNEDPKEIAVWMVRKEAPDTKDVTELTATMEPTVQMVPTAKMVLMVKLV